MRTCILLALLLFSTGGRLSLSAQPAAAAMSSEVEVFNGQNFSGWIFVSKATNAPAAAIWSVTNGVIACEGKPNGYARTLASYHDYKLHVEWRFPAGPGNSGVFLHLTGEDKVWPTCLEAQLQSGSAGEIRLNGGAQAADLPKPDAKSFPRRQPSSEKPPGEWNSYDLTCRSNSLSVWVNGVLQNEITDASVSSGAIGLQAEGKPVEFRNLVLEPLP